MYKLLNKHLTNSINQITKLKGKQVEIKQKIFISVKRTNCCLKQFCDNIYKKKRLNKCWLNISLGSL